MSKHYREKALLATTYKIQKLEKQSGFIKKNVNIIIFLGVVFSFFAPFYSSENSNSVKDYLKLSYTSSVLFTADVIFFLCLIAHIGWTYQDNQRMKILLKRKKELEDELKSYD